jgi:osmotically inducible protein OsmC
MTRIEKVLYTGKTHTTGGRDGASRSSDGRLDIKLSSPGTPGSGTNPEQLFAAGYSACFHNALILVGNREGYDLTGSTVAAKVGIGPNQHRGYGLAVALSVSLPILDAGLAAKLVDAAHEVCPYSNATRGNIDVTILLG